jgi:hypothetical protein
MMNNRRRLGVLALVGALAAGEAMISGTPAQEPPPGQAAGSATFRSVPVAVPTYAANPYAAQSIYPNYLSGAADVIDSQGQMMVSQQQAYMMKEQVRSAKIDNRRKALDESLYERAVTPTQEDERERQRIENVRRSRNDPPLTEIWSGQALNNLLLAIQQQLDARVPGPNVPLDPEMLRRINVTSGAGGSSLGLLRDGGRLRWPLALRASDFEAERTTVDESAAKAFKQAEYGSVDTDTILNMRNGVDKLQRQLRKEVAEITPNDYVASKRFLNELDNTVRGLQDANVANYAKGTWSARGRDVAELVQNMRQQGLKFAPAVQGEETAYTALHGAMVAYYAGPNVARSWDPLAK